MLSKRIRPFVSACLCITGVTQAAPTLIAKGSLDLAGDLSGLTGNVESGLPADNFGGLGSGLAWAGGTTFLGVPDRGPNAAPYTDGAQVDNTTTFISRFHTLDLQLTAVPSDGFPYTLTSTLSGTTLLYSAAPLIYGTTAGLPSAVPALNAAGRSYFTGRSDNFGAGLSNHPDFARLDPEAIRVSKDGNSVFIADEYGPYVYQFDRATGARMRSFALPDRFAIANLNARGAEEISGNASGRVTNKGMEGLAITPDGNTLVGFMQSPLAQDGGDGGRANRIVTIDVATGATHEYAYDNRIGSKNFNSSEILALNDHQFLILERDGKGLGDGSVAVIKQLWAVDLAGAQDVGGLSGEAALLARAPAKTLFLDITAALKGFGIAGTQIPAKLEGIAFGRDIVKDGVVNHTLYLSNDNDFVPGIAGPNVFYVFAFTDADLAGNSLSYTAQSIVERGPDLSLLKTAQAGTVITGGEIDYTLTVKNKGLVAAGGVQIQDLLPPQVEFSACVSAGICDGTGNSRTIAFAALAGGASQTARLTARLGCAVADKAVIVNRASAAFSAADPDSADNAASATLIASNPKPVIGRVSVIKPSQCRHDRKKLDVQLNYSVADNCGGTACSLGVTSKDGDCRPGRDWKVVNAHLVRFSAEASKKCSDRNFSINVTCRDSGGAVSAKSVSVQVPRGR